MLYTGGTLGMRQQGEGPLEPDSASSDLARWVPELGGLAAVTVEILANIDSSTVVPQQWLDWAARIQRAESEGYAGIVLLHGTDTLAWTAAALSFLLPGLEIPLVLTGSQRPLAVARTDARVNMIGAAEAALDGPAEVMLYFHDEALRGNRATKVATDDFSAFASPNFPPLGRAGIDWDWQESLFLDRSIGPPPWPQLPPQLPAPPVVFPWIPGVSAARLGALIEGQWAVILEAFGSGNVPVDGALSELLSSFIEGGGLLFVRSQCQQGSVRIGSYAPGQRLVELGALSAHDMTREAIVTKLMVLAGLGFDRSRIARLGAANLVGECSAPRLGRVARP